MSSTRDPNHLPHLVLSGFMGTGKSTLGRLVAEREGVPFVDLDEAILAAVATANAAAGAPPPSGLPAVAPDGRLANTIADLFTHLGEPGFRRLEAQALARALDAPPPTVIAVGGGALLDRESRARALATARVVTLTASPAVLLDRINQSGAPTRPLLAGAPDRAARIRDLLAERATAYAETHATIATDELTSESVTYAPESAALTPETATHAPETATHAPKTAALTPETATLAPESATYADNGPLSLESGSAPLHHFADVITRAWRTPSLLVRLGARSYPACFTGKLGAGAVVRDLLTTLRPSQWFLVTDTTVDASWGAAFGYAVGKRAPDKSAPAVIRLKPGEREKHLAAVERVLSTLVEAGADRDAVIVAHGGGVVSDIAGFAAAILLRGVRWISVPTTLLSMADAAIGGKTGVDLGRSKNAVGAFHQPSAVVIDVRHTTTESERAFTSGLAEIVKSGAIADPELITLLESETAAVRRRDPAVLEQALLRAVAVKAHIVALDERESGPRALLNFGHTLGHALEAAGDFERWTHGEAVSLGMVAALRVGVALGLTEPAAEGRIVALLAALGLPTHLDPAEVSAALKYLTFDKKRRGSSVRLVLLATVGHALIKTIPLADLAARYGDAARDAARDAAATSC